MEKEIPSKSPKKQASIVILVSEKIELEPKLIRIDSEDHYMLIKWKLHQEDMAIHSTYAPKTRVPKFMKRTLLQLKLHIVHNTLIVGEFDTQLLPIGRSSRQRVNR